MPNVVTQTALITPTSGTSTGALADYEMAKFRENNGTVVVAVDLVSGDIVASLGTINSGTITRVEGGSIAVTSGTAVVTGGSIVVTTGTVNAGTVDLLKAGTVTRVEGGSIVVTAGTFTGGGGSVIAYGAGGTGVVAVGNPQVIAGTDSGGTTYGLKVNTSGNQQVDIQTGTITSITNLASGTITKLEGGTLGILSQGSINVTAGTVIVTNGTIGAGTLNTLGTVGVVNNIVTGTIASDTIIGGTLQNLASGTINSATVTGNLGTLSMLSAGTVTNVGTVVGLGGTVVGTSIGFPLISGEDQTNDVLKVENQMNGTYLQAAGTTTLKGTAAGLLHTINIGLPAVSDVITAYDSQAGTSGTIIAKITLPGTLLSQAPMFGLYDIKFTNGLAISQTGTSNISVSWR